MIVNGPSLTKLTSIFSWKIPQATSTSYFFNSSLKLSYNFLASVAFAAFEKLGLRDSKLAHNVNCETDKIEPPTSFKDKLVLLLLSLLILISINCLFVQFQLTINSHY